MKFVALTLLGSCCLLPPALPAAPPPNTLTPQEKAAGWKLLFDGHTPTQWRSYGKIEFPEKGWTVKDGWLEKIHGVPGGNIMTVDTFHNFDLQWEWKIAPRGNNGIKYFITLNRKGAIGHEYQMLDDADRNPGKHCTASFYDVLPPTTRPPGKPAGEINHSRILVRNGHVEHWLNGVMVLAYECGSAEVKAAVAKSKFKNVEGFGTQIRGHILLTDHNDGCSFRSIKIRPLP